MDEEVTTSFWISFFVEAGIPPAAAANYAIIFTENRIQKHMLLDLNKEYLKDMGVNVLGDIIAILKHSKRYHEKVAREKVLAIDKETSVMKATKHLNEMLLKDDLPKTVASTVQQTTTQVKPTTRPSPPKKLKTAKSEVMKKVEESDWIVEVEEFEELKRKVIPPKLPAKTVAPTVVPNKAAKKTSVFDRLGESNVTSTTPEILESPSSAPTVVTANKPQQSSVFRRLGGIQDQKESPASPKTIATRATITPAQTVKRITAVTKTSEVPDSGKTFLRMDTESSAAKQSARERLGLDRPSSTKLGVVSTKVVSKNPMRTTSSQEHSQKRLVKPPQTAAQSTKQSLSGVKQRLGSVATVKGNIPSSSSSSSVFKRLGVTKKEI